MISRLCNSSKSIVQTAWRYISRRGQRIVSYTRWELYSCTSPVEVESSDESRVLHKLSHDDYDLMLGLGGRFADQVRLFHIQRGICSAYGVFLQGKLAHVSWVYSAREYQREPQALLRLTEHEAEITNAYTLAEFRGKHIFSYALQRLTNLLLQDGIRCVYAKAAPDNYASLRAITGAGFQRCGSVISIGTSLMHSRWIFCIRI